MARHGRLTDAGIKALPTPRRGAAVHHDDLLPGFGLRCSVGGTKSWVLTLGKDRRRLTIGRYPLIGLSDARTAAKRLLAEHTLGKHRAPRITYSEALQGYLEDRGRHNRPRTMKDTTRILRKYFAAVQGKQLEAITTHELTRITGKLADQTPGTARHAFSEARAFFRWCVKHRYIERSPLEGIDPPAPPRSRARVLSDVELQKIWAATEAPTDYNAIIRICMLTGLRRGEASKVEPDWVQDGVLTIPKHISKNGLARSVPVPSIALPFLARCPFASNSWSKNKLGVDKASGVTGWVVHDLRRTAATLWQRECGALTEDVEFLLGHVTFRSGLIGTYQRWDRWPRLVEIVARYDRWMLANQCRERLVIACRPSQNRLDSHK